MENVLLEEILNNTKETFVFGKKHKYCCLDLGIAAIFDIQVKLKKFIQHFEDIDLRDRLDKFFMKLLDQDIIYDYRYDDFRNSFYIKPENKKYNDCEIRLEVPSFKNRIA